MTSINDLLQKYGASPNNSENDDALTPDSDQNNRSLNGSTLDVQRDNIMDAEGIEEIPFASELFGNASDTDCSLLDGILTDDTLDIIEEEGTDYLDSKKQGFWNNETVDSAEEKSIESYSVQYVDDHNGKSSSTKALYLFAILGVVVILVIALIMSGIDHDKVEITSGNATVAVGDTVQIHIRSTTSRISASYSSNIDVEWNNSSSNKTYSATVTGLSEGNASLKIYKTENDKIADTISVTVLPSSSGYKGSTTSETSLADSNTAADTNFYDGSTVNKAIALETNTAKVGSLPSSSDKKWYCFTLLESGKVSFDFSHPLIESSNPYWVISVYESTSFAGSENDLGVLLSFNSAGNDVSLTSSSLGLPNGTYFVKVTSYSGSYNSYHSEEDYNLAINYEATELSEQEINNSAAKANEVVLNDTYSGSITTSNDKDWYRFELNSPGIITLNFAHEIIESSNPYWVISVYDSTKYQGYENDLQGLLSFNSEGSKTSLDSSPLGLPVGTYYIQVTSYSGSYNSYHSDAEYGLTVNYTETGYSELEINNSASSATNVVLNQGYSGSVTTSYDKDWYRFDLSSSGIVTLNFKHELIESSNPYWTVVIYDASSYAGYEGDLKSLLSFNVDGNKVDVDSSYLGLPAGTYYVLVMSYSGSYNSYHSSKEYVVSASYTETSNTELEINDKASSATNIALNTPYVGSISTSYDTDWFMFNNAGSITVNFKHEVIQSSNYYWAITLYDASNYGGFEGDLKGVKTIYVEGNNSNSITAIDMPSGTYYIKVTSYSGSYNSYQSPIPYEISIGG